MGMYRRVISLYTPMPFSLSGKDTDFHKEAERISLQLL